MKKIHAFLIHLITSIIIFIFFLGIVFFIWYPGPHYEIDGGLHILVIMAGVDIVLGPLLTLILFRPGKWGLKFDMTCIILMQVSALIYGAITIYEQHPAFMVFTVDRFSTIPIADVDFDKIKYPELKRTFNIGPVLALATFPEDREERQKLMFAVLGGEKDIDYRPDLYKPYQPDLSHLRSRNIDISKIMQLDPDAKQSVITFLRKNNGKLNDYLFFPLKARKKDVIMVLSAKNGMPKGWIDASPWLSGYANKATKKKASPKQPASQNQLNNLSIQPTSNNTTNAPVTATSGSEETTANPSPDPPASLNIQ